MVGLGWTGPWVAEFARDASGTLTVRAGLEGLRLRLRPDVQQELGREGVVLSLQ